MRSNEPDGDFGEEPRRSVAAFRVLVGTLLLAFAVLVAFLIFRGATQLSQSNTTAPATQAGSVPATTNGIEVPTLAVANGASSNGADGSQPPLPTAASDQMIEVAPVAANGTVPPTAPALPANLVGFEAKPAPGALAGQPNPFFGPNYVPNDGKPIYVCAVDSFASYLTLMQMQTSGKDVQYGFHLGIVPYSINGKEYEITQAQDEALMKSGAWDCDLGTVDTVARTGYGVITAVIDESAGGDGIYARGINSIYDLKSKRLGYVKDTSSELFARYTLQVAQLTSSTVTLVPFDDINNVVTAFDANQIDAMSGWDPYLRERATTGGKPLVTSEQLRVILDVVVTAKLSIQNKPQVVQAFHDAYFDTLKTQLENYDYGAALIAAWGHNEWSSISKENAGADLRAQMQTIAQADLQHNARLMTNLAPIYNQIEVARRVWAEAGPLVALDAQTIVDTRFVLASAARPELQTTAQPLNTTFTLAANQTQAASTQIATPTTANAKTAPPANGQTAQVVLPCKRFTFLPDKADLSDESRNVLNLCVVAALQQRPGSVVKITGSAAWPGPAGTYSETQVLGFAKQRAQSIANYLASQGVDPSRLAVNGVLPPVDHRETLDANKQAEDRYVEMTLITTGL